jgi:hypothetical protein
MAVQLSLNQKFQEVKEASIDFSVYKESLVHRITPGEFLLAGMHLISGFSRVIVLFQKATFSVSWVELATKCTFFADGLINGISTSLAQFFKADLQDRETYYFNKVSLYQNSVDGMINAASLSLAFSKITPIRTQDPVTQKIVQLLPKILFPLSLLSSIMMIHTGIEKIWCIKEMHNEFLEKLEVGEESALEFLSQFFKDEISKLSLKRRIGESAFLELEQFFNNPKIPFHQEKQQILKHIDQALFKQKLKNQLSILLAVLSVIGLMASGIVIIGIGGGALVVWEALFAAINHWLYILHDVTPIFDRFSSLFY